MRLFALVLPLLCFASAPIGAQEPPKNATVDQLATRVLDLRKQKAEITKAEAAALAELKAELKRINDLLGKLGIDDAPKPPEPVDPLRAKLAAAFETAAGSAEQKREWRLDLAALYRQAAKLATDPTITTASQLKQKLRDASATLIGPDALKEVRQAVAGELARVLPTTDADLTDAQKDAASELFKKLAEVLEGM